MGPVEAPALAQLQLAASGARWAALDAAGQSMREGLPPELSRALRRRRFLVEKARAASIVGAPRRPEQVCIVGRSIKVKESVHSTFL